MTSYLLAGPDEEPIALVRAKAWLRVEDDAEDGLIEALITAARIHIEGITGRALLAQSWRVVLDAWPGDGEVRLPVGPVIAITEVRTHDGEGTPEEIDTEGFSFDAGAVPARLLVPAQVQGAGGVRARMGIEIDYVAGLATEPAEVPGDLIQALLVLVGYWYENRDAVIVAGAGAVVPAGFDRLVSRYRRMGL
ncbi:head-tail connector protein [Pelagibacterium montanilacus]|uniref:head-tail connector protein n=1 Tax=Pelagibacterium montanilacus TaxID=2185280 RepID=UPI000F8D243E|nr:head-tail connector protein [Pelagibacterium montanilacus]